MDWQASAPTPMGLVLIVDDIESNARLLGRLLERDGHQVIFAHDGQQALDVVSRRHPDLVVMDVIMPTLDGLETCRRLKADPVTRLVPVVLVTALNDSRDRVRGLEVGADDFVSKPVNAAELTARVRSLLRIKRYTDDLDTAESVIISLAMTIEARDRTTDGHCQRLARYAVCLGEATGLSEEDKAALARGGFLHDIGKIGLPDSVLLKPGPLTAEELAVMRQHTVIGDRLCGELRALRRVRPIVRHHHERLDGSGYPDGLRGRQVPLLAQVMSIVDIFDALTSVRPYKPARSTAYAFEELLLEASRGWRDRELVNALIGLSEAGRLADGAVPPSAAVGLAPHRGAP